MEEVPLEAVASVILVLIRRARDWDANIPVMATEAPTAVTFVDTYTRISFDRLESR
jgi:hypothetical protein